MTGSILKTVPFPLSMSCFAVKSSFENRVDNLCEPTVLGSYVTGFQKKLLGAGRRNPEYLHLARVQQIPRR